MLTFMVGLKWILGLNGFWAWNGFGFGMCFRLEWVLGLNGSWAWIVNFQRHFRVLLHSEITYFLVIGLSSRASNRGCLQMPPWFFEKPQTCIQIFQKINLQPDTHPQQNTHTDAHTWFLPSTEDVCSSTGLRWGITLDNCSTGEIFGNSTKPDTSHDNHWLQLGSKVFEFSWLDFPLPGDFDFEFSWLSVAEQRYDTWVFLARYYTTKDRRETWPCSLD